jgi:hypothetical protein
MDARTCQNAFPVVSMSYKLTTDQAVGIVYSDRCKSYARGLDGRNGFIVEEARGPIFLLLTAREVESKQR